MQSRLVSGTVYSWFVATVMQFGRSSARTHQQLTSRDSVSQCVMFGLIYTKYDCTESIWHTSLQAFSCWNARSTQAYTFCFRLGCQRKRWLYFFSSSAGNVAASALLGDLPATESSYSPEVGSPAWTLQNKKTSSLSRAICFSQSVLCCYALVQYKTSVHLAVIIATVSNTGSPSTGTIILCSSEIVSPQLLHRRRSTSLKRAQERQPGILTAGHRKLLF